VNRPPTEPRRKRLEVSGRRVIVVGAILVLIVSVYVMIRIVQTSGPRPPANEIPKRPGETSGVRTPGAGAEPGDLHAGRRASPSPGAASARLRSRPDGAAREAPGRPETPEIRAGSRVPAPPAPGTPDRGLRT